VNGIARAAEAKTRMTEQVKTLRQEIRGKAQGSALLLQERAAIGDASARDNGITGCWRCKDMIDGSTARYDE